MSPTPSPPSSRSSSPPLALDPNTLALLNSFYAQREEAEAQFAELEQKAEARLRAAQEERAADEAGDGEKVEEEMMTVDEFRKLFGEDWQLSQFWYSTPFSISLAKYIRSLCPTPQTTVAFLCCPTGYVGFQHTNPLPNTKLLEFDRRFAVLPGGGFVHYDIDEPENIPEELRGTVEIAVADPPFLNEVTNRKLAASLRLLLHPTKGRLVLLTSTSVEHLLPAIYDSAPVGPLHKSDIEVTHAGGISNAFGVWTSWGSKAEEGKK